MFYRYICVQTHTLFNELNPIYNLCHYIKSDIKLYSDEIRLPMIISTSLCLTHWIGQVLYHFYDIRSQRFILR